jgi:hypothetical protein
MNWLAVLPQDEQSRFFAELAGAAYLAEQTCDAAPVEACLRRWRVRTGKLITVTEQTALADVTAAAWWPSKDSSDGEQEASEALRLALRAALEAVEKLTTEHN